MKTRHGNPTTGLVTALLTLAVIGSAAPELAAQEPAKAAAGHGHAPGGIVWGPAPAIFPAGAEMAVVQGDPHATGEVFTVRLRMPDGYFVPPHWHPTDEHVTVLTGTLLVGLGDTFSEDAMLPPVETGGFITAPARVNHFAKARGATVLQIHAIGPFQLTYVDPKDDPRR